MVLLLNQNCDFLPELHYVNTMPSTGYLDFFGVCHRQIRLFVILSIGCYGIVRAKPVDGSCEFHSSAKQTYAAGASWEVRVGSQKDFQCMNCTCLPATLNVQCLPLTGKKCPDLDDCLTIVDVPNSCCPICTEVRNQLNNAQDSTDAPTSNERHLESSECVHNGIVYQEGERWAPDINTTSVRPMLIEQCVQCECSRGYTVCYAKMCAKYNCNGKIIKSPDNCCPVCEELLTSITTRNLPIADVPPYEPSNGVSEDDFDPYAELADEEQQQDCISGPERYEHGSQWQPIIPPFGRIKCVTCECFNSQTRCKRAACPDKLPCSRPVTKPGQCCPVCDESNEITNVSSGTFLCVRNGDYLVYENLHEGTVEILLRLPEEDTLWKHTWRMGRTSAELSMTEMKMWEFRRLHSADLLNYRLLGVSRPKKVNRFSRRIKRIRQTCHQRCSKRTERLIQLLQIQAAQSGRKSHCPDKSRPVNTVL